MNKCGKNDSGKLDWSLLPIECIEDAVAVLTMGAEKYSPDGWKSLERLYERYYSAAMRHIAEWKKGNKIDEESGKNHLAHAMVNLMFLLWKDKQV